MTRNATARTGLVPLWGRLFVSWYFDVLLNPDEVFWHLNEYDRTHRDTPIVAQDNLLFFVSLSGTPDYSSQEHINNINNIILSSLNKQNDSNCANS